MAKVKARNVEYYQYLFVGTGTEFDMKKLYQAAYEADTCCGIPERTADAYQIWASNMLRHLEKYPEVVTIKRTTRGFYEKVTIHNVDKAISILTGGKSSKIETTLKSTEKTPKKEEESTKATVTIEKSKSEKEVKDLSDEDKLCVVGKALRQAARNRIDHKTKVLIDDNFFCGCSQDPYLPQSGEEIIKCFSECELDIPIPVIDGKYMNFSGYINSLEKVCAFGAKKYPRWTRRLWNFEDACGGKKAYEAALQILREEEARPVKIEAVISSETILTDDDKFRTFIIGGYLMDQMERAHDNASIAQLSGVLSEKGKGLTTLRLEALVSSTPEFFVDGDEVYLKLGKEDKEVWWNKFRKKYRPLSGETEQIIFKAWMDLSWASKKLKNCKVSLIDELPNGFNVFRVDLPKNSVVARYSFADLLDKFQKDRGEIVYTESKLISRLRTMKEKKEEETSWKLRDDIYRWEIGLFGKKGV